MDRRQLLGMASTEGDPAPRPARPRLARLVEAPAARRLGPSRLGLAAGLALCLVALALLGGGRAARGLASWLHGQTSYRLDFGSIELDPEPPAYFRPGKDGLVEEVRRAGRWPESISTLDLDAGDLANDFRLLSPWVARVESVRRVHPNRVVVRLAYRAPVALMVVPGVPDPVPLDREATVLPRADITPEALAGLPMIVDQDPAARPTRLGPGSAIAEPRVIRAVELADFLRPIRADARAGGQLSPSFGHITLSRFGLYLKVGERFFALWDRGDGRAEPALDDRAKWSQLEDWLRAHRVEGYRNPDYLEFSDGRLVLRKGS